MPLIDDIKKLREETGLSVSEVKKALEDSKGDAKKAKEVLKALGKKIAEKKGERETKAGIIDAYLHTNARTGVLLDIRCESDFVAKSPEFKNLAHELCLQIAAMSPEDRDALLLQAWIKDDTKTVKNLVEDTVAKVGENIEIKRFARFDI